jgi:HEAT repeat protein
MDKLVERERAVRSPLTAAPALAVQFFLIPLAVIGLTVIVYGAFRSMVVDDRSAAEYLNEIRTGGTNRRWPAAYELSRLMADPKVRADRSLAPTLIQAFDEAKDDDPRVRQYLALALGRLDPPMPPAAVAHLADALDSGDTESQIAVIWALGSSGDPSVVRRLQPLCESPDAGVRKMAVYALGALPGDTQVVTLRTALGDSAPDVRWNAALALARHGNADGVPVLRQMLDRAYVEETVRRESRQHADEDPIAEVMISGVRAVAALKVRSLRAPVEELSQRDRSMKVRQEALEALRVLGEGEA